jgi:argininosuccinate synthase
MERMVLGYSGSLETSIAIAWLAERFGVEVIAVTLDVGQGRDLADVRERALAAGAVRAHVLDVRDELARAYVLPALQAGAIEIDGDPLGVALARPLLGRKLVEVARMEGATSIAHGCQPGSPGSPGSEDETRFERTLAAVDPSMTIVAPLREWNMTQPQQIEYAKAHNILASPSPRVDANLWARTIAADEARDDIYLLTRAPEMCPEEPARLEIGFLRGVPVRANGIEMSLAELIESVETIAGAHGVGRIDRSATDRKIYEAPAASVLVMAHEELEALVVPEDLARLQDYLAHEYRSLIDAGLWFGPKREAIDSFASSVQRMVSGSVRLELFKGQCRVVDCRIDTNADLAQRPASPVAAAAGTEGR